MLKTALQMTLFYANTACTDKNKCFKAHINELTTRNRDFIFPLINSKTLGHDVDLASIKVTELKWVFFSKSLRRSRCFGDPKWGSVVL